jgi:16S rRNA (guanine527-N7)-methyltransferase
MQDLSDLNVSREIIEALKQYQQLIIKWNDVINIVSRNSMENLWGRHVIDSLQLLKFIPNKDLHLIDVGSGGGFPGIVLSIAGIKKVTLIESDVRKSVFLLQASKISNNVVEILPQRIESIDSACDILTSRAFAQLDKLLLYTRKIEVKDKYLLLKGESYQEEIQKAMINWSFDYNVHNSVTSNTGKILEINNVKNIQCLPK